MQVIFLLILPNMDKPGASEKEAHAKKIIIKS